METVESRRRIRAESVAVSQRERELNAPLDEAERPREVLADGALVDGVALRVYVDDPEMRSTAVARSALSSKRSL